MEGGWGGWLEGWEEGVDEDKGKVGGDVMMVVERSMVVVGGVR